MKDKVLIISVVLAVGCLILAVLSGRTVQQNSKALDLERYNRMVAEEKMEKALQKVQTLENSVANAQSQLQNLQTVLEQEKISSDNLKRELEKTEKLKMILEQELKNALVTTPASTAGQQ